MNPSTPTRRSPRNFDRLVARLSKDWDLRLESVCSTTGLDSPSKQKERSKTDEEKTAIDCIAKLKFLYYKEAEELPVEKFEDAARTEMKKRIYKLNGHTDTLRIRLLDLLRNELEPEFAKVREKLKLGIPKGEQSRPKSVLRPSIDDSPIAYPDSRKPAKKRSSSEFLESSESAEPNSAPKRSKRGKDQSVFAKIDNVPVTTRTTPSKTRSGRAQKISTENSLPNYAATKPGARRESALLSSMDSKSSLSTNFTSFSSSTETKGRGRGFLTSANTSYSDLGKAVQTSGIPDISYPDLGQFSQLSDLGPDDIPSTPTQAISSPLCAIEIIKERLQGVFPRLPKCLEKAPLGIRYEIVRVFLHTKVPLSSLDQQKIPAFSSLQDYETLWQWLKGLPALSNTPFPSKSDINAWEMSLGTFGRGFKRAVMTGGLRLTESDEGPLFAFQLNPLKIDLSYRLGRRFGHDRFMEISMPIFERLPKTVAHLLEKAGISGRELIIEWLHKGVHQFLGRTWGLFYVKDKGRKRSKGTVDDDDADSFTTKNLCFFATSGIGFERRNQVAPRNEPIESRSEMTVEAMLNWLLSLQKNGDQSYLKFYSRISLGLSTTYATAVLLPNQIKKRKRDVCSEESGKVMNDGCGRMSNRLAMNISTDLGLTYVPSAFQGRIGEAKGLWIVDYSTQISDEVWIETYPSQRKWERTKHLFGASEERDEEQRTFEVIKWSSPLRSAALTLQFLPLLEDRGVPREAISQLLVNGLTHEIGQMVAAIQNPQSFRKWLRDNHPSVSQRLKTGVVNFKAGLPESFDETLNMLLDAGFDPKRLGYARELARKAFRNHCETLKEKLNIRVGLSTYAYIAVDFQGVLKPDEIHLSFSNTFQDEVSGRSMLELDNMEVLIARSPAHFVSDIQKVRAVFKPELMKYKDVVILPSTGDSPLAGLLSGGDYDGDTVWLCFDQEIVRNFQNGEIPQEPDLLKNLSGDGAFLKKNTATFSEITASGGPDSFSRFLQKSFDFNFRLSYLGICTNHKERCCYEQNSVNSVTAVYLSTLLGCLVDQAKQGYEFAEEDWRRLIRYLENMKPRRNGKSTMHIKDYLKGVAEGQTEKALKEYHESLPDAEYFDTDLTKWANDFRTTAKSSEAHRFVLERLEREIEALKKEWSSAFNRGGKGLDETKEDKSAFRKASTASFDQWQDIQPVGQEWLKGSLLQSSWKHRDHSDWALLKASVLFGSYAKGNVRSKGWTMSSFPWYMACRQLCVLKAMAIGSFNPVTSVMYAMLKPDAGFVKMIQSEKLDPRFREAKGDDDEDEDDEYDDDDEEHGT